MKFKYLSIFMLGTALTGLTACNDFLNMEPESSITPAAFFSSEADLAAYSINLYNFSCFTPGSYGIGTFGNDNGTDNQAATGYSNLWVPGERQVPSDGGEWDFKAIRNCNYFLDNVLPKYEAGQISGSEANIRHYIGEVYLLRANNYFNKLQSIGDCAIIETAMADDKELLMEATVRRPRHIVARFILSDLDKAIELLAESGPGGKNRISKDVAYLLKSRVALYEGTWLKHHAGTAFVPGGSGWPGSNDEGFNSATEIKFFLEEAMKAAKVVGDKLVGNLVNNTDVNEGMNKAFTSLNPYFTMFCDTDMDKYSEVLMWREFIKAENVYHNIQMQLQNNGGGTGWTRGLVNSYVMRNGLPIYAAGSGYDSEWEKQGVTATLQERDSRIQLFTKKDKDIENFLANGDTTWVDMRWVVMGNSSTKNTTGYANKKGKHYDGNMQVQHYMGTTGSIVFRGTEALLNYMEANCELNNGASIDQTASNYWQALRERAKVNKDYMVTVNATDLDKEAEGDWGVYSHGKQVTSLLYNIRRERRNELIGEGLRWMDLKRWRACDQVQNYHIEGMRYWGSIYEGKWLDKNTGDEITEVDVEGGTGNMSSESISGVYIRPYQITKISNSVFEGYNFTPAHYLTPIAQSAFRKASPDGNLENSVIYQNPGWSKVAGTGASNVN